MRASAADAARRLRGRAWLAAGALVALAGLGVAAFRSAPGRMARAGFRLGKARAFLADGDAAAARGHLREALAADPRHLGSLLELAGLELRAGDRDQAFLSFEALTELHPEVPDGWVGLAELEARGGLTAAPEQALDQAVALAPGRADARLLRAEVRLRQGRYRGALIDARVASDLLPGEARAWALLARCSALALGAAAGVEVAERGLRATSQDPALRRLAACLREAGGGSSDALARCAGPPLLPPGRLRSERALLREGVLARAREHWTGRLAELRRSLEASLQRRDWDEAARMVATAEGLSPGTQFAPFLAGVAALGRGDADAAEHRFREALERAPRSPVVAAALAKSWSRRKGAAFAAEQLAALAEPDPGFLAARALAARASMDAHDPGEAEAVLRRGVELQPASELAVQQLADLLVELDRPGEAIVTLEQGLARHPQGAALQQQLAALQASQGRTAEALRLYGELATRRPDLDLAGYALASLLATASADGAGGSAAAPRLEVLVGDRLADRPSDPLLLGALGWASLRTGRTGQGRELLEAAVRAAPDEPVARYHLAVALLAEYRPEQALAELRAAVDSAGQFAERVEARRLLRNLAPAR